MSSEPFVAKSAQQTEKPLLEQPLITRYNIFIENYNKPNCIVDNITLDKMNESSMHNTLFLIMTDWKGKVTLCYNQVIYTVLLCIPVLNCLFFLASVFCTYVYWSRLNTHEKNLAKISDPFKNMVFDPELCFKLHKDFYAFTIEFKGRPVVI